MKFTDVIKLNHEIGVIRGVAVGIKDDMALTDLLFATAEILDGIADKLMQEVMGNETA
jgi:hypothetical protein